MLRKPLIHKNSFITFVLMFAIFLGTFTGCSVDENRELNVVGNVAYEVYIEQGLTDNDNGLIVGLPSKSMQILESADAIYDGENELDFIDGKIVGLTDKILGSENNELKIIKGSREYILKYMYVTRAIRNVYDLSLTRDKFPSAHWINSSVHPEGLSKYTPYIFEIDIASNSYEENARIPTNKVEGYFVLADDIDVDGGVYSLPDENVKNVIKSGHADYRPSESTLAREDIGFIGTFDGRGHTIKNITTWQGGLFGYINGGTIKNLALIGACNYWQGQYKNIFADFSKDAKFENIYVSLKQQKADNGGVLPNQDTDGWGYSREFWACLFSRGNIHVKNCVLESFILEGEYQNNTNYMQFINNHASSTYENVHCVGSSPLAISSFSNFNDGVQLMVTEKELEEFGLEYGSVVSYTSNSTAFEKYYYVMVAMEPLITNRAPLANTTDIQLVKAKAGVEKYDTIAKFKNSMKNDSVSVNAFMQTGCWDYDSTTGALTWKNK